MKTANQPRSKFWHKLDKVEKYLIVSDEGHGHYDKYMTVTNDIERVLEYISKVEDVPMKELSQFKIIYKDSEGEFNSITTGERIDFHYIPAKNFSQALIRWKKY